MKDIVEIIVKLLGFIVVYSAIALGMAWAKQADSDKKFNGGYCSKCNSELEYVNATYEAHNIFEHVYICNNCGHIIECSISPEHLPKYKAG